MKFRILNQNEIAFFTDECNETRNNKRRREKKSAPLEWKKLKMADGNVIFAVDIDRDISTWRLNGSLFIFSQIHMNTQTFEKIYRINIEFTWNIKGKYTFPTICVLEN